jgi:hypothetical protein
MYAYTNILPVATQAQPARFKSCIQKPHNLRQIFTQNAQIFTQNTQIFTHFYAHLQIFQKFSNVSQRFFLTHLTQTLQSTPPKKRTMFLHG